MKTFGITLAEGSDISNMTVDSGAAFPPEPSLGELFYMTDGPSKGLYLYDGEDWVLDILEDDGRLSTKNTVVVQKEPGPGQYGSIKEAIDAIDDATEDNRYVIHVAAGSYFEDNPIQMKRFVSIYGVSSMSVIVHALNPNLNLIHGVIDASLRGLDLADASAEGSSAIYFENTIENNPTRSMIVENIRFRNNARNVTVRSESFYTALYLFNAQFGGAFTYDEGLRAEAVNGAQARLLVRNCFTRGSVPPLATRFGYVSGVGAEIFVVGSIFRISTSTPHGTGFHVRDGGTLRITGSTMRGFETAILMENAGAAPMLNAYNLGLETNAVDLDIAHPGTRGAFVGIAAQSKVRSASDDISIMYLDPVVQGTNIVGRLNIGATQDLLTDVTDLIIETAPLGLLQGGQLLPTGGRNVTVLAGAGYLRKDGHVARVNWPDTAITLAPGAALYIAVNKNGQIITSPAMAPEHESIHLGRAQASADSIVSIGALTVNIRNHGNVIEEYLRRAAGPVFVSGSIVTENPTTPRAIDVTAGMFYFGTSPSRPSAKTAPMMIDVFRANGTVATVPIFTVPNDTIDNGTSLVPMTPGYFTKHVLYTVSEGAYQAFYLSHGQAEYATLDDAIKGPNPLPRLTPDATPPIAALIMQQGRDSIAEILDIRPMFMRAIQGTSGGVQDHGDLIGLQDDDHPQYLLTSGNRALAGDFDAGGNDLLNVGLINGLSPDLHGFRHNPNGADPIATGAPLFTLTPATQNEEGLANSLARSDHTHRITGFQPLSGELSSLAGISTTGIMVHAEPDTWHSRTLEGASGEIVITNANGVAGNPTFGLGTAGTPGTYRSVTTDAFGRVVSGANPTTLAGYGITDAQPLDSDLTALAGITERGLYVNTGPGTATTRVIAGTTGRVTVANANGMAGNPTIDLSTVGTAGTYRSVTTDAYGRVTLGTNPTTLAGYGITDAQPLDIELTALANVTTPGIYVHTGAGAATSRAIAAGSSKLSVSNGTGVAGNPTLDVVEANLTHNNIGGVLGIEKGGTNLAALGTANQVLGVNAAATGLEYKSLVGTANHIVVGHAAGATTLSVAPNLDIPGTGGTILPTGTTAQRLSVPGVIRFNTTLQVFEAYTGTAWQLLSAEAKLIKFLSGSIGPLAGTTLIPYGTSPTSTQGTQLWTQTVTPLSTTSRVEIQFSGLGDLSTANAYLTLAIFRGTTLLGISMLASGKFGNDFTTTLSIHVVDTPGTTAPVTYQVRIGASTGTWYFGRGQNATFGGTARSHWTIKEYE